MQLSRFKSLPGHGFDCLVANLINGPSGFGLFFLKMAHGGGPLFPLQTHVGLGRKSQIKLSVARPSTDGDCQWSLIIPVKRKAKDPFEKHVRMCTQAEVHFFYFRFHSAVKILQVHFWHYQRIPRQGAGYLGVLKILWTCCLETNIPIA